MKWKVDEFLKVTSGQLVQRKESEFNRISYDTRITKDLLDSAFFAFKGLKDGHDFLKEAYQKGAHVLVIAQDKEVDEDLKNKITVIKVPDPLDALLKFAVYWRKKLNFKTVAITGSNGKTSSKHFAQILLEEDSGIKVSPHSFNNELGVCLGLLQADLKTHTLIQEVGINAVHEMKKLLRIVLPNISVCTTVNISHIEGLQSEENIAKEKSLIYQISSSIFGIFNLDNAWTLSMKNQFKGSFLSFSSQDSKADVCLKASRITTHFLEVKGHIQNVKGHARLQLAGEHQVVNVMTALSIALALGKKPEDLWKKLSLLKSLDGRCQFLTLKNKLKVFYDAYNSNPQSMKSFLDHLSIFEKQRARILCIGDMLELGHLSLRLHQQLGMHVASQNWGHIFFIGESGSYFEEGLKEQGYTGSYDLFKNYNKDFVSKIFSVIKSDMMVAIKASRGLQLERLLKDLENVDL